jgi:spermidine/putrescine transport system ATP-binding protein
MSDTVVVMNEGNIQQIGTPQDIYNEPVNAFTASFIGESNIVPGIMHKDFLVEFAGRNYECVDGGFAKDEPVDIVVRPEDVEIAKASSEFLCGTVTAVTFKGVHYEMLVDCGGVIWRVHSTDFTPVGADVGLRITPEDIHIMHRSDFGGEKG